MFKLVDLSVDYKELEIIKNALLNEIDNLENQNFANIEKEDIEEYKQVLKKINKKIKLVLGES